MKKLLLLIAVLTASLAASADVAINSTNFPDANFRSYLMSEYPSGTITTAQLNARTELEVNNKGISNMKGVEYFAQLTKLSCYGNNLTSIDVSNNTKLTYLNVFANQLTSIQGLVNCTVLEQLYLHHNNLTTLDVTNHSALRTLWVRDNPNLNRCYCYRNALTNLDIANCTSLLNFQCYENPNLSYITGLATCTALTYLDVEDCAFTNLNDVESLSNLVNLYARNNKFTSLSLSNHHNLVLLRAQGNPQLTSLDCYSCNLSTLNVTNCTALKTLKCYYNANLSTITGLSSCTALTYLDCEDCAITDLPGVNNMNNLQTLWCRNNQLTGELEVYDKSNLQYLRVSGNTGLTTLHCNRNALTSLDVSNCTALVDLDCGENSALTKITGLTTCTALIHFSAEYCALNTSLDMSFCPDLETLYCYHNNLTGLNVTGLSKLTILNCMQNAGITDIVGLAGCTALTYLECSECALTSLEVDNLTDLQELLCRFNQFTALSAAYLPNLKKLDVTGNSLLEDLDCYNCALTELYVYDCPVLNYVDCRENQLSELATYACPQLMYLLCNENQLTELELRYNSELLVLWCRNNLLTSLDLSHCSDDFYTLDCRENQIAGTLDVSRFAELFQLACSYNEISELTLGTHPKLQDIMCQSNQLTSLDVNDLPALETLYCSNNQLTSLNVSACPSLEILYAHMNKLNSLNLSGCPVLRAVGLYYNKIKAAAMGQFVNSLPIRSDDSPGYMYALVDEYWNDEEFVEENVITASQVNQAAAKYWNVYIANDNGMWEPYAGITVVRGDVNDDGSVDISDATTLINYLLTGNASDINLENANCDQTGGVDISDATTLINYLLNGTWPNKAPAVNAGPRAAVPMLDETTMEMEMPEFLRIKRH